MLGAITTPALTPISSVYPSDGLLATSPVPMVAPAPPRLSTTTFCFHSSDSDCPTARPT